MSDTYSAPTRRLPEQFVLFDPTAGPATEQPATTSLEAKPRSRRRRRPTQPQPKPIAAAESSSAPGGEVPGPRLFDETNPEQVAVRERLARALSHGALATARREVQSR
jgi:hypothetical protein